MLRKQQWRRRRLQPGRAIDLRTVAAASSDARVYRQFQDVRSGVFFEAIPVLLLLKKSRRPSGSAPVH
jgi:hypothetical protein